MASQSFIDDNLHDDFKILIQLIGLLKLISPCSRGFCCSPIFIRIVKRAEVWSVLSTHSGHLSQWFSLRFCEDGVEQFRGWNLSIPEEQQIFIPHSLQGTQCNMNHHHKLEGHSGVTRRHSTEWKTYYWSKIANDGISAVQDSVHCA